MQATDNSVDLERNLHAVCRILAFVAQGLVIILITGKGQTIAIYMHQWALVHVFINLWRETMQLENRIWEPGVCYDLENAAAPAHNEPSNTRLQILNLLLVDEVALPMRFNMPMDMPHRPRRRDNQYYHLDVL